MTPTKSQIRWSAGKFHGRLARVDRLAALYIRLETLVKLAEPPRDDLIRLRSEFAELRAACHVEKCGKLLEEPKR